MNLTHRNRALPYVNSYKDRHGKVRHYFRRGRVRVCLPGKVGSPEWREAYDRALSAGGRARPTKNFVHVTPRIPNGDAVTWAIKRAFSTARSRAPRRKVSFGLTLIDVRDIWAAQGGLCAVTGIAFRCEPQGRFHKAPFAPSLDRIDCRGGYTKENVRLVCVAVNFALGEWGEEVFAAIARGYLSR